MDFASYQPEVYGKPHRAENIQQKASEALFGDVRFRPSAYTMASLIDQGLTDTDILTAGSMRGYKAPIMHEVLQDLNAATPFIQQISDKIAKDHGDETIWLAARDFEAVADDLLIRYPELNAHLLPASQDLLRHETMEDPDLTTRFLGRYGLTAARIADPGRKFAVFDSGFRGTIGQELNYLARRTHGTSLQDAGRLTNKLVSIYTAYSISGEQLMDFPEGAASFTEQLPRASRIAKWMPPEDFSDTLVLAVMLQTLPRFHAAFGNLADHNGNVVAMPRIYEHAPGISYEPINDDVDRPYPGRDYEPNASIINPVAAAVVMHRVVKSALELKPSAMEDVRDKVQISAMLNLANATKPAYPRPTSLDLSRLKHKKNL